MIEGKKLGLVGRCLLGAGLALSCASCENMTESDMFALGLSGYGVNAETPQQAQSAYVLSEFARESGRRQHEMDVAREGKTEVNVNVYNGESERILKMGSPVIVHFKRHNTGIKGYFYKEEKGSVYIYDKGSPAAKFPSEDVDYIEVIKE